MTDDQRNSLFLATPIMLDLDGNGIQTLAAAQGTQFDLLGNGRTAQWGWTGGADGLLAMDLNGDGLINDGRELFGSGTRLADGSVGADGYTALAQQDSDGDGDIDAQDANFNKLSVWVDADHDGVTDSGELKSLGELGIVSLNLNATKGTEMDNGNVLGLVSQLHALGWQRQSDGRTSGLPSTSLKDEAPALAMCWPRPANYLCPVIPPPQVPPLPPPRSHPWSCARNHWKRKTSTGRLCSKRPKARVPAPRGWAL